MPRTGFLGWVAQQLEASDRADMERLWKLASGDVPRLARCLAAYEKRYPKSNRSFEFVDMLKKLKVKYISIKDVHLKLTESAEELKQHRGEFDTAGLVVTSGGNVDMTKGTTVESLRPQFEYAKNARMRGIKVIIAGAGLSAALPGVVAAHSDLPVIGVPLTSRTSVAGGLDALLSISQMPPGVPVACVGVDNARNAAVLAARILGI